MKPIFFKRALTLLLCLITACHALPAPASETAPEAQATETANTGEISEPETQAEPENQAQPESDPEPAETEKPQETPEPEPTAPPETDEPKETPTVQPESEPEPAETEKPQETPESEPTAPPETDEPKETPTVQPETDKPEETPAPESRLRLESYEVLDADGRRAAKIERDDRVTLVMTLSDDGLTVTQAGGIDISHGKDSFELIDERPQVPEHDGKPHAEVLSGPASPLRLRVIFPNAKYSGEEKTLRFVVRYASGIAAPIMEVMIEECVPSAPATDAPATDTPSTDTPPTDAPATNAPSTDAPSTDAPATNAPTTDAPATSAPATDTPSTDAPATNAPATDAPATSAPATDAPITEKPKETPTPEETEPTVLITRGDLDEIKAGQEFTAEIIFVNKGTVDADLPVVTLTMPDGLILREKTASFALEKIAPGAEARLPIRLAAKEDLSESQQTVDALLKFEYLSAGRIMRAAQTEKIYIPVKPAPKARKAPLLGIGREELSSPVQAGQAFTLTLLIRNEGTADARNLVASLSPSDALSLTENTSSLLIKSVPAGETVSAAVSLRAAAEIPSALQYVQVDLKYDYAGDKEAMEGSAAEKVLIPAVVKVRKIGGGGGGKPPVEPPVPNVIVSRYDYGSGQVAAGTEFPLSLTVKNTAASRSVENMMMTVETDENITITSASNTVYVREMAAGEEKSTSFKMQALPNIKTGSAGVTLTFKYEYVANDKRSTNTLTEKISIPVYQPDRMQLSPPQMPESVTEGEEAAVSIAYFNKGKSDVYNLSAELQGDIGALSRTQTPGNIEPGKSGTIDFILTPAEHGDKEFSIVVTYEDAAQNRVSRTFPARLKVMSLPDLPAPDETPEEDFRKAEESGRPNLLLYLAPAGAAALLLLLGLRSRIKRKKLQKQAADYRFDE